MKRKPDDESTGKQPGFYLYVGDLELELQALSLPAQGLWMRMLLKMHRAPRRGFLEHQSGIPYIDSDLARLVGITRVAVGKLLEEMRQFGTFSRDEKGVIFNRRMVKDTELSAIRRAAGALAKRGVLHSQNGCKTSGNDVQLDVQYAYARDGAPARPRVHSEVEVEKGLEVETGKENTRTSLIDDFENFCVVASEAGMSTAPGDITSARFEWNRLDFEQRLNAVRDVPQRVLTGEYSDPKYIPLPATYLKGNYWFRPQKPARSQQTKQDQAIEVFHDLMEDRIGKSTPEVQSKRLT